MNFCLFGFYNVFAPVDNQPLKARYRLWDEGGVKELGFLAKPVGFVLNTVGDLLRIQGESSIYPPEEVKKLLSEKISLCPKNGINTPLPLKLEVESFVSILEAANPTVRLVLQYSI